MWFAACGFSSAQSFSWPAQNEISKPWVRWWWPGNAVDTPGLRHNLEAFAKAGIGGTEITPIYGVKGLEQKEISYLSPAWMQMLRYVTNESGRLKMGVDMATGTGWPFGGPQIPIELAASKAILQTYHLAGGASLATPVTVQDPRQQKTAHLETLMAYPSSGQPVNLTGKVDHAGRLTWTAPPGNWTLIALFAGKTFQKVKRASPGGEGWVIDHFSSKALDTYLQRFTTAFSESGCPPPHAFFNDSYEVFGADWTPGLLEAFAQRRGYRLEDYLPALMGKGDPDTVCRVISDYRETLADLLLEHFTRHWTDWAHEMHSITRNQAHGSPGNLLDLYGTVDIPEIESYGSSHFDVPGVPEDSMGGRPGALDPLLLKFASSAAHVMGKPYASSETFTWLGEHFRVSLSQCKPVLDEMWLSGINHVFFHGSPYSPKGAPWPGWQFYAAVDFSPYNPFWQDIPAFNQYIARTQSFLQKGKPDNDVLLYWPAHDVWGMQTGSMIYQLTVGNATQWLSPTPFHQVASALMDEGYGFDYVSDRQLDASRVEGGCLVTPGATTYKALVVPPCKYMPLETLRKINALVRAGAKVIFMDHLPDDVPGLSRLAERRSAFARVRDSLGGFRPFTNMNRQALGQGVVMEGADVSELMAATGIFPPGFGAEHIDYIRRKENGGYIYFLANLHHNAVSAWVPLSEDIASAVCFDPYSGAAGKAAVKAWPDPGTGRRRNERSPRKAVFLQLEPGQSLVLEAYTAKKTEGPLWVYDRPAGSPYPVSGTWKIAFEKGSPAIPGTFSMNRLESWTLLGDSARVFEGTARYRLQFEAPSAKADDWLLDLGEVDFSAEVTINGHDAGTLWGVPFSVRIGRWMHPGTNTLEIAVTNLGANRIADYDRRNVPWKIFDDINVVSMDYRPFDASAWAPVASGLLGPVTLTPLNRIKP